jgi:hypothetical protein
MRRSCFGYETSHKRNMAHPRSRQALEVHWINEGRHHIPYNPCVGSLSPSAATKTRKSVKTNRRSERHAARHALRDDAHARLNGWPNHPETVDYLGGCFFPAHSVRAVDAWLCLVDQFETHIGGETGHAGHSESGGDRPRRAAPDWARVGQSGPHNLIPGRHHDRPLDDRMVSFCGCHGVGALRRSSFHLAGFNAALAGGNRTAMGHGAALDVVLRRPKLASGNDGDGCAGLIDLGAFNGANTCASSGDMSHHLRRTGARNVCHTVPLGAERKVSSATYRDLRWGGLS